MSLTNGWCPDQTKVMRIAETGACRGYAFLSFLTLASAQEAIVKIEGQKSISVEQQNHSGNARPVTIDTY